jgi:DMSO/TMAO reductase YedYZ molybdopterin-dependent catalytic subunit
MKLRRRHFLQGASALALTGAPRLGRADDPPPLKLSQDLPAGTRDVAILDALPGKQPLIKLTFRPPNYETPLPYFKDVITPNDAFFVRYHLAFIPEIEAKDWRLKIAGAAASTPVELGLDDLNRMDQVEVTAVCQSAGNRRGFYRPPVTGVQFGHGGMGNARWRGVRLKDVLAKVGVKKEAIEVAFDGGDMPVVDETPDFVRSLPIWKALDENVLIATTMNGEPLPAANGFPARLVVPGWVGEYWIKHLASIDVLDEPHDGYWMKTAYRVPLGRFPTVERFVSQETATTTPVTELMVNALITSPEPGDTVAADKPVDLTGLAWDAGYGITAVDISADNGKTWMPAKLGDDLGRFSFRQFSARLTGLKPGAQTFLAKATNRLGASQPIRMIANPGGYLQNVVSRVAVTVA